jgi:hypothetical protein
MNNNMKIILLVFMSSIVIDVVIRSYSEPKSTAKEIIKSEHSYSDKVYDGYSVDEFSTHSINEEDYSRGE